MVAIGYFMLVLVSGEIMHGKVVPDLETCQAQAQFEMRFNPFVDRVVCAPRMGYEI